MKKLFSHPLFYIVFALLGLLGMGLQIWFFATAQDCKGLLQVWHPATIATIVLLVITAVLTLASASHVQPPRHSTAVRALGAGFAAVFSAISAVSQLRDGLLLSGIPTALAAIGCGYVIYARLRQKKLHYVVYALFAVALMTYLISRYRLWSAEPEMTRYAWQLLALVCLMLVFYQKAALLAHAGKYPSYHFWRSMALMLSLTAIPGSQEPFLYLSAAAWLLLDPSVRPLRKPPVQEVTP